MPGIESDNFIGRTIASAKADPKKAAALLLLLVVLIGMWIKMAMGDKTLPQPASAATSSSSLPPVPTAPGSDERSNRSSVDNLDEHLPTSV